MDIIQTKDGNWFCTESRTISKKLSGKKNENVLNLWYQPFPYPCDFFWYIKDGEINTENTPMRDWENDLPLSECLKGTVKWVDNC